RSDVIHELRTVTSAVPSAGAGERHQAALIDDVRLELPQRADERRQVEQHPEAPLARARAERHDAIAVAHALLLHGPPDGVDLDVAPRAEQLETAARLVLRAAHQDWKSGE